MPGAGDPGTRPADDGRGPDARPPDDAFARALAASPILVSNGLAVRMQIGRCFLMYVAAVLAALVHVAIIRAYTTRTVASGRFAPEEAGWSTWSRFPAVQFVRRSTAVSEPRWEDLAGIWIVGVPMACIVLAAPSMGDPSAHPAGAAVVPAPGRVPARGRRVDWSPTKMDDFDRREPAGARERGTDDRTPDRFDGSADAGLTGAPRG